MTRLLLAALLVGCSHDPRDADIVPTPEARAATVRALESWRPLVSARIATECGSRACIRVEVGNSPFGDAGYSWAHGSGDCEVSTGDIKDHPLWRIFAHELGHCFGLEHTKSRCNDGSPDLMNLGDRDGMRLCEPTLKEFREVYGE